VVLADEVAALDRSGQKQESFLDVRGEVQQVHDLRHAGAGDVPQADQVGLASYLRGLDQPINADRHRHQAGDA